MEWSDLKDLVGEERCQELREDLGQSDLPTQFYRIGSCYIFIFRNLFHSENQLKAQSEIFVTTDEAVYKYNGEYFENICKSWEEFIGDLFFRLEKSKEILLAYIEEIERLEDNLFERKPHAGFLNDWFDLKKVMTRMERFLGRQNFVFKDIIRVLERDGKFNDDSREYFQNFGDELSYLHHSSQGTLSRLDNIHNFFSSLKDEKINKNIYFLTVLSGLFLPLNLIVGFFGMNTQGLFFSDNPQGTFYVVYILGGIVLLVFLGFNVLRLFDKIFVRWWLGKTRFYQRMSERLEVIENRWRF